MTPKQRYKERLKLRAAIARVLTVAAGNHDKGIPPDRKTARMATQVILMLTAFCEEVGLTRDKWRQDEEIILQLLSVNDEREAQTVARYRRKIKAWKKADASTHRPRKRNRP
jgi:hypothetical protein